MLPVVHEPGSARPDCQLSAIWLGFVMALLVTWTYLACRAGFPPAARNGTRVFGLPDGNSSNQRTQALSAARGSSINGARRSIRSGHRGPDSSAVWGLHRLVMLLAVCGLYFPRSCVLNAGTRGAGLVKAYNDQPALSDRRFSQEAWLVFCVCLSSWR